MKLEYKKYRVRDIEPTETGYYFKGELLSRTLTESLRILRERVKDLPHEDKIKTDEWAVIHYYYDRQTKITKRIHKKKKDYYKKLGEKAKLSKIYNLKLKIDSLKERKLKYISFYDDKIKEVKKEIKKVEESIK